MSFKVLENNGTYTTASEGITINKANLHNKSGIIKGRLNDLEITNSSNTLYVDTGHLVISGINLILEESSSFVIAPVSSNTTKYLIAEIVATSEGITAELQIVNQYSDGGLDFSGDTIIGTYRKLIAYIGVGVNGIRNISLAIGYIEFDTLTINIQDYVSSSVMTNIYNVLYSNSGFKTYNFNIDIDFKTYIDRKEFILDFSGDYYTLIYNNTDSVSKIWSCNILSRAKQTSVALVFDDENGTTTINVSSNIIAEKHLYEHNIVLADEDTIRQSYNMVIFRVLTDDSTPLDEGDVAELLYERGNSGIESCIVASGRNDSDSFMFINHVDFSEEDTESGYCDSVVIGVYGNGDGELMVVYMSLNEDDQNKIYSTSVSGSNWNDTVVQIF